MYRLNRINRICLLLFLPVPSVLHEFPSSHSVYNVTVVAYNEHRRKKMTQEVCLQDRLQGQYNKGNFPLAE